MLRRLAGKTENTAPVQMLVTQMGGGKTHMLTTLWHLSNTGAAASAFPSVGDLLSEPEVDTTSVDTAAVALVGPVPQDQRQHDRVHYDLGQATMAMLLAAVDRGVASAHSGVADYELARRLLGHPEDRFCPYLLSFGYPPEGLTLGPLRRRRRRTYDEVVHLGRW